jgi:hypothetical protein
VEEILEQGEMQQGHSQLVALAHSCPTQVGRDVCWHDWSAVEEAVDRMAAQEVVVDTMLQYMTLPSYNGFRWSSERYRGGHQVV